MNSFLSALRFLAITTTTVLLTIITQIGGLVYLLSRIAYPWINQRVRNIYSAYFAKLGTFLVLYLIFTFVLIPPMAKLTGRVALPVFASGALRPLRFMTCLLNRHYVKPELNTVSLNVAKEMNSKFPGTSIQYLDANFPFINKFPLIPHLSHNDGKKLDLAFYYKDFNTGEETNEAPSLIGYGICEEPGKNELNTAKDCEEKGYWQYSLLNKIIPQTNKQDFKLDNVRTRQLVLSYAKATAIEKIFLEPHLMSRLNLHHKKLKFHGCQAVRHDDHIHIQIR